MPLIAARWSLAKCDKKTSGETRLRLSAFFESENLFQAVFVRLDHLFDHLATDGTGLLGSQVAVITLFQVHAHLP